MTHDIREIADALGARAEEVCRRLLPRGARAGGYWRVGDVDGAPGRSMWVRLEPLEPPGRRGKWVDAATGEHGDLLDLIRYRVGAASLGPALDEARAILALPAPPRAFAGERAASTAERTAAARRLWEACRPLAGTRAEAYLRARGIEPGTRPGLRFHPALHYRDEGGFRALPALVAAVTTPQGELSGIHRTWLDPCAPAKAPVAHPRKALGPVYGHAVRLQAGALRAPLLVGEGLETVLSVLTALPGLRGAAALSAPGLGAFPPPDRVERVLIARDNDHAGERAAERLECRCRELGVDVTVITPEGGDFNDDLLALGPAALAERIAPALDPARS